MEHGSKQQLSPDNTRCIDCGSIHPQWISINNAVYVCYNCSGIHRGFGVQISFIRSLSMDAISEKQYKMLSLGGNKRFNEFMEMYGLTSEPAKVKYKTKAAEFYRGMLKAMAEGKNYTEPMPDTEEGKKFIPGFEDFSRKPVMTSDRYGNDNAGLEVHRKAEKKGFFDKMFDTAKDWGEMTKVAAGAVWEKGKSIKDNKKLGKIASVTKKGITNAGKAIANTFGTFFGTSQAGNETYSNGSTTVSHDQDFGIDSEKPNPSISEFPVEKPAAEEFEEVPEAAPNVDLLGIEDGEEPKEKIDGKPTNEDLYDLFFENGSKSSETSKPTEKKATLLDID